jgi:hypothetical protein
MNAVLQERERRLATLRLVVLLAVRRAARAARPSSPR